MKIAVLSDIHGNLQALRSVAAHVATWNPDQVYVNGDVINRGARPRDCLKFVQEQQETYGWKIIRGNHEDFVLQSINQDAVPGEPMFEISKTSLWTYEQLGCKVDIISDWPQLMTCTGPDGEEVRITHASMQNNRESIFIDTPERELLRQIKPAPAVFCTAHTHHAWIRYHDGTVVVNSGSVGAPFDGYTSASYAQLTWHTNGGSYSGWHAEIIRLDYDRKETALDFHRSGYMLRTGPMAKLMYAEWKLARSLWPHWQKLYLEKVMAGKITTDLAVKRFLQDLT